MCATCSVWSRPTWLKSTPETANDAVQVRIVEAECRHPDVSRPDGDRPAKERPYSQSG
jgi:hypothetical protein